MTKIDNLTIKEIENLKKCKTVKEWNNIVCCIQEKRGGQYPPDWYTKIILGKIGLMANAEIIIQDL